MTTTYQPYNGAPPFEQISLTSALAAQEMKPHAGKLRERVFEYVKSQGDAGATSDEIEVALGLIHQTASARARELVLLGRLRNSGNTRKTRSGRHAAVLVVTSSA